MRFFPADRRKTSPPVLRTVIDREVEQAMDGRKDKIRGIHLRARYAMTFICALYNSILTAGLIFTLPVWLAVLNASRKRRATFRQRMGWWTYDWERRRQDGSNQTLWIHALSVGEVYAAQPLVNRLLTICPDCRLVLTVTTRTGFQTALKSFGRQNVRLAYFPYDLLWSVRRMVQKIRPAAVIIVETDIWPNFLREMHRRRIPVHLVNLRFSPRTWRRYRCFSTLTGPILKCFERICVQTSMDAKRLSQLGVAEKRICIAGNLKFDQSTDDGASDVPVHWRKYLGLEGKRPVIVAGSTHEGEEPALIRSLSALNEKHLDPLLIMAPRDPQRAGLILQWCREQGLTSSRLSDMGPDARTGSSDVIIVDTIGQLKQLYRLADVAFVGGSLEPHGGHNPLEPAIFGKPVVFGPHMFDFKHIAEWLLTEGGAYMVRDSDALRSVLHKLLKYPELRAQMGHRAHSVCRSHQGAAHRTIECLNIQTLVKRNPCF